MGAITFSHMVYDCTFNVPLQTKKTSTFRYNFSFLFQALFSHTLLKLTKQSVTQHCQKDYM